MVLNSRSNKLTEHKRCDIQQNYALHKQHKTILWQDPCRLNWLTTKTKTYSDAGNDNNVREERERESESHFFFVQSTLCIEY